MLLLALTLDVLQDLRAGWILFIGLAAFEIAAVFDATGVWVAFKGKV